MIEAAVERRGHDPRAAGKRLDDHQPGIAGILRGEQTALTPCPSSRARKLRRSREYGRFLNSTLPRRAAGSCVMRLLNSARRRIAGKDAEAAGDTFPRPPSGPVHSSAGCSMRPSSLARIPPDRRRPTCSDRPAAPDRWRATRSAACPLTSMAIGTSTVCVGPLWIEIERLDRLAVDRDRKRHGAAAARLSPARWSRPGRPARSPFPGSSGGPCVAQNSFDQDLGLGRCRVEAQQGQGSQGLGLDRCLRSGVPPLGGVSAAADWAAGWALAHEAGCSFITSAAVSLRSICSRARAR